MSKPLLSLVNIIFIYCSGTFIYLMNQLISSHIHVKIKRAKPLFNMLKGIIQIIDNFNLQSNLYCKFVIFIHFLQKFPILIQVCPWLRNISSSLFDNFNKKE